MLLNFVKGSNLNLRRQASGNGSCLLQVFFMGVVACFMPPSLEFRTSFFSKIGYLTKGISMKLKLCNQKYVLLLYIFTEFN